MELNASPICCEVDFSLCGCNVDAAESDLPLSLSPKCSVVDFSESGYMTPQPLSAWCKTGCDGGNVERTFKAAVALSVKLWRPVSDIVIDVVVVVVSEERSGRL